MAWRRKEPGHQHPWYWLGCTGIIRLTLHVVNCSGDRVVEILPQRRQYPLILHSYQKGLTGMMTSSNGNIFRDTGHLHKGQWRGALMFSLICIWINGWVNKDEGGDLRRHRAHNDVIVMERILTWYWMGNKPLSKQIHWLPLVIRRQRFILNILTVTKRTWHVGKIIDLLTWFYLISVSIHDIPQMMHPVHALLCFVWVKCR